MALLVRTWNLFHGNAVPPERRGFLREMVELVSRGDPDVVCLQEVPVWALSQLASWSGMTAVGAVASRPRLGPLPWPAAVGGAVTELHHGMLRSALTGQANAILVAPRHRAGEARELVLNSMRFRRAQARWLGLDGVDRLAWAKERRVCQALRVTTGAGDVLFANLHATSYAADERLADAELRRAAVFVEGLAGPDEPVVLCGDTNVLPQRSATVRDLVGEGFAALAPGIDQVLARGLAADRAAPWPEERRRVGGRLLSDHAPVEAVLE